jgi:hypothetical protein
VHFSRSAAASVCAIAVVALAARAHAQAPDLPERPDPQPAAPSLPAVAPIAAPRPNPATVPTAPTPAGVPFDLAPPVLQEVSGDPPDASTPRRDGQDLGLASTLHGPVGLLRTTAAQVGARGSWRLALRGEYASGTSFIVKGDRNRRLAGNLVLSLTPLRHWELFAAILASTNHNERCSSGIDCPAEPARADPAFIRAFGDVVLGTKIAGQVSPRVGLGVQGGVRLYTSDSSLGFDGDATSPFIDALGTFDFRRSAALPVVVHANLGYVADRSRQLGEFDRLPPALLNSRAVASFAYGITLPRVRASAGLAAPVTTRAGAAFSPFVEYQLERITGDADAAFADYTAPRCGTPAGRACSDGRLQQRFDLGLRAALAGGLGIDLAIEIAAGSVGVAFGPPLPSWNLVFGLAYAFAPTHAPPPIRTVTVERVVERPVTLAVGYVGGRVLDARDGMPIGGAIVDVVGATRAKVATDSDGAFITKALGAGAVELEFGAPGFGSQALRANVAVGVTTPVEVTLLPLPPPLLMPPGPAAETSATTALPTPTVPAPAPGNANVRLQEGRLVWRRPLRFEGTATGPTARLTAESRQLVDELATLLGQHPEIDRVRIEAHWDSGIGREAALALTQSQADAVAQALVERGFPAQRLEAVGVGSARPKVVNLGPQSRARNQRVEITLPTAPSPPSAAPAGGSVTPP